MSNYSKMCNLCKTSTPDTVRNFYLNNYSDKNSHDLKTACYKSFEEVCKKKNLVMAQCLLEMFPGMEKSTNFYNAFKYACWNGQREVAMWLYQKNPDLANNFHLFLNIFEGIHYNLNMAQWLQSLRPYWCTIDYNPYGYFKCRRYSRQQVKRWNEIKYAIWLENQSIGIFGDLPIDICKRVFGFI